MILSRRDLPPVPGLISRRFGTREELRGIASLLPQIIRTARAAIGEDESSLIDGGGHNVKNGVIAGPFNIRYLHIFVSRRAPGAFILSRKGRAADFVGASADDVGDTLARFVSQSGYRYFWFAYASSAEQAYSLENQWYHRFHPTDNPYPPSHNSAASWRCTTPGCTSCALRRRSGI